MRDIFSTGVVKSIHFPDEDLIGTIVAPEDIGFTVTGVIGYVLNMPFSWNSEITTQLIDGGIDKGFNSVAVDFPNDHFPGLDIVPKEVRAAVFIEVRCPTVAPNGWVISVGESVSEGCWAKIGLPEEGFSSDGVAPKNIVQAIGGDVVAGAGSGSVIIENRGGRDRCVRVKGSARCICQLNGEGFVTFN